ncbi:hypothetical protein IPL68_04565 [Candidatus Saccharibacteria bacterium]|nr:MAG: hypothetical protein IPL68_04565 [Candidatus Saccharibacteria bacterium]
MKQQGLLAGSYEHGLQLTRKAQGRLERIEIDSITVTPTTVWDGLWRIIIYDIPEEKGGSPRFLVTVAPDRLFSAPEKHLDYTVCVSQ